MSEAKVVRVRCPRPACATARWSSRTGALPAAVLAGVLALGVSDRAGAQPGPSTNLHVERSQGAADGNRAPRSDGPRGDATTAAPVFELARRSVRPRSRRARVEDPWSVALSIGGDGAWTRLNRSGRLTLAQLAEIRAAITRTVRVSDPASPPGPWTPWSPMIEERVTWGARTATWLSGPGGAPGRDMRHLIELAHRLTRGRP